MFCSAVLVVYIVMFHGLLQLSYSHKSTACDVGCPPRFELLEMESDNCSQQTTVSSLAHVSSKQMCSSGTEYMLEDVKDMIKTLESELYFSAKAALSKDIEHLIEEEVHELVKSIENSKLHEVT